MNIDLNEAERRALVRELRNYADMRADVGDLDQRELRAELADDPTIAPDEHLVTERLAADEADTRRRLARAGAAASPFHELAEHVERTGRLNLDDPGTLGDLREVVENTGWSIEDEHAAPPPEMRRVVAAVTAHRQGDSPADEPTERPLTAVRDRLRRHREERREAAQDYHETASVHALNVRGPRLS